MLISDSFVNWKILFECEESKRDSLQGFWREKARSKEKSAMRRET